MKGWHMYSRIHQLKEIGFKKRKIARKLGIDVKTVAKYWDMTPDEYHNLSVNSKNRRKYLEVYEEEIVTWLKEYPDMSSAEIHDWLKEKHKDSYYGKDRTVRYFVSKLREKYSIPKAVSSRQYQAVADLPMGHQAQVDFGEKVLYRADGTSIKLYCMVVVLAHSRYKYAEWWDKPLTSAKLVELLNHAFEYFGGVLKELVFDQDKIVAVSENHGDVIYTQEFERYRQNIKFKVYLCRGADPESKGKIEAVVKYVKNNYAAHRKFVDLASFNSECFEWLKRTGNATIHGITKRIPAEVFVLEKQYLQPISPQQNSPVNILTRGIRKDNTILFKSNRYSVPLGTYQQGKKVFLTLEDANVNMLDPDTSQVIARHKLCLGKGQLIQNNNHLRDNSKKIAALYNQVSESLGQTSEAETFLVKVREDKPRYVRDQYLLAKSVANNASGETIQAALKYCVENELWSAIDFRAAVEYFSRNKVDSDLSTTVGPPVIPETYRIKTTARDIKEYVAVCGGGSNE